MNKTYSSKLSGYVFLLTILTIGTIAFTIQAQDFGITGDVIGTNFFIEYEFKSRMLGAVMGAMFDRAFRMFSEAFERRADVVYGVSA